MGNLINRSFSWLNFRSDRTISPRIDSKDLNKLKSVWKIIEQDSGYYGFAMCTVIFKNHPQYAKYFEDETIPMFVQEAKVKKKFTMICDMIATLFLDYNEKPAQRKYLLRYIAMIHKDMGLSVEDFENFMEDVTEALVIELPNLMTDEYILIQRKYFYTLTHVLFQLMEHHNKEMARMLSNSIGMKKCCPWNVDPEFKMLYGYPLKHWLYKKRYWEYRKAVWASIDADMLMNSTIDRVEDKSKIVHIRRKTVENTKTYRRKLLKAQTNVRVMSTDSDQKNQFSDNALLRNRISLFLNVGSRSRTMRGTRELLEEKKKESRTAKNNKKPVASTMTTSRKRLQERNNRNIDNTLSQLKSNLNRNNESPNNYSFLPPLSEGTTLLPNQTARQRKRMRNEHVINSDD